MSVTETSVAHPVVINVEPPPGFQENIIAVDPQKRIMSKKISEKPPFEDSDGCARCGCSYYDHKRDAKGPCLYCGVKDCPRFLTQEQLAQARFFDFYKWARRWIKAHRNRKIDKLRRMWENLGNNLSLCTYCAKCKTSTFLNSGNVRSFVKRQDGLLCNSCKQCSVCCGCLSCERCKRRHQQQNICLGCKKCKTNCCHCRICPGCKLQCCDDNDATTNHREGCGRCNVCCECGDTNRVPLYTYWNRQSKHYTPTLKQHNTNKTSRLISAEIEAAGIRGHGKPIYELVKKWDGAVVYDGSLPKGGFEVNTAPAGGDIYVQQVKELCNVIREQGGFIDGHCGLHVHIDARDFDYYDIRRLVMIYAPIEMALFAMVPSERQEARFCHPCGQKYVAAVEEGRLPHSKVKTDVITCTYRTDGSTQDLRNSKYNQARYNALNLHSWFFRQTIECRMFNGTINPDEIISWGVLWAHILDYTKRTTDEEIAKTISSSKSVECLIKICGDDTRIRDFIITRIGMYGSKEKKKELDECNKIYKWYVEGEKSI